MKRPEKQCSICRTITQSFTRSGTFEKGGDYACMTCTEKIRNRKKV